jgi:type II secretory pathway pseudopilin PulG
VICLPAGRGAGPGGREGGFSLVELTVTLIVVVEIILGALLLYDFSGKLSRVELQVSDLQQSLRVGQAEVIRVLRMAGRGELPVTNNPAATLSPNQFAGTSIAVRNNAPAGTGVIAGTPPTDPPGRITNPRVLAGTDVLTIRGVFSTPLYQVNASDATAFSYDSTLGTGTVTIAATSPTGVPQPFDSTKAPGSLQDAINNNRAESLILVSPVDDSIYGVAQLDVANSTITGTAPNLVAHLAFKTIGASTGALSAGGAFPGLRNAAFVGILEEYRYYVRETHAILSDLTSPLMPLLSRARFYAGSDTAWDGDSANLYQDIADGIMDLQIALGFDVSGTGVVTDTASGTDDWLFNSPDDNVAGPPWSPLPNPTQFPSLFYVRVSLLARTSGHDPQYKGPVIVSIEDHVYSATPTSPDDLNGSSGLTMRRRLAQTVVGIRNRV